MVTNKEEILYESPCWDDVRNCTWFVDVYRGRLLKLETDTIKEFFKFNFILTSVNLCESNRLILTSQNIIFLFDPETLKLKKLHQFSFENSDMRINDCKVSNKGELIFSYFEDRKPRDLKGSIGIFEMCGSIRMLYVNQFVTPNGIALDGSSGVLWCADTGRSNIYQIDLKSHSSNGIEFGSEVIKLIQIDPFIGRPDGANLDALGNYWVALHGGGRLGILSPNGDLINEFTFLEPNPTMVCFSGAELNKIDITFKLHNEENCTKTGIFRQSSGTVGRLTHKFLDS